MATSKQYCDFVLGQLAGLDGVSVRAMMGEYVLYYRGKVVGGIYDDRLLLKPTPTARRLAAELGDVQTELPYPGAKPLLAADADRPELLCRMIEAIAEELPARKK